jgi:hypothetical protein
MYEMLGLANSKYVLVIVLTVYSTVFVPFTLYLYTVPITDTAALKYYIVQNVTKDQAILSSSSHSFDRDASHNEDTQKDGQRCCFR